MCSAYSAFFYRKLEKRELFRVSENLPKKERENKLQLTHTLQERAFTSLLSREEEEEEEKEPRARDDGVVIFDDVVVVFFSSRNRNRRKSFLPASAFFSVLSSSCASFSPTTAYLQY